MRSVVRALLPVAVLLLGLQLAAAGRTLQQTPKSVPVALTRQQFVQATFGLKGVTCDQVSAILNDPFVNNTFSRAVIADFQTQLIKDGWPAAAAVVVAVRQPCLTSNIDGENYASYRTMIRFNSTNSTSTRDTMFAGLSTAVARPCTGGYNRGLYRAVTALFAQLPFNVSQNNGNRQNVFFPNGPGPTGFGDNWIDYASPAMSYCDYLRSPSPSPSPEVPSPSPEVPSPSPSPIPCPEGAERDASGACVCNTTTSTPAFNGTTLLLCINSTNPASCPAEAPVEVKTLASNPVVVQCITESTPCPTGFTLVLYNGNPSVRQECRPNNGGCNYAGFGLQVTSADNTLIGCANATSNACPFVAYRSAPNFALDRCVDTTACPAFSTIAPINTAYTVPALAVGASLPTACLTLDQAVQSCPSTAGLAFPIEVIFSQPTSPVCGGATVCQTTRAVQCLAVNSTCPAGYSLRVFANSGSAATPPELVECRQTRAACDLTAAGMTSVDPNAGLYNIAVRTGDALDGCVISTSTVCPAAYPFAQQTNGQLEQCSATAPPPPGPLICTASQIPLYNSTGVLAGCQDITTAGVANPCPNAFPISLRKDINGNLGGCLALTSTCPADYSFPFYGFFSGLSPAVTPTTLTVTNCWAPGVLSTCTTSIAATALPAGIGGSYSKPILSNSTGTERTVGCILEDATRKANCPAAYPFAFYDLSIVSDGYSLTTPYVAKCYPAGEVTACQAAGGSVGSTFSKPAYTKTSLAACMKGDFAQPMNTAPTCISAFPVVVLTKTDPSGTATNDAQVVGCWSADSTCTDTPQTFTLQGANSKIYCVPPVVDFNNCAEYPATDYRTGPSLYSPNGATLIGCSAAGVQCSASYPIYFRDSVASMTDVRCQASLSGGSCSTISNGGFTVTVTNGTGSAIGCVSAGTTCAPSQVTLSTTPNGAAQSCSDDTTQCVNAAFPFPLYDGRLGSSAKLVRCLPAQTATNCNDDVAFLNYNLEVYGTADGSGNVVGCMRVGDAANPTVCPSSSPIPYMAQVNGAGDPSFVINQCRPGPATCTGAIPIKNTIGSTTLGCLATGATTCPGAVVTGPATTASPYIFPFILVGTTTVVEECRQLSGGSKPLVTETCEGYLGTTAYPTELAEIGAPTILAGCAKAGNTVCPTGYLVKYTGATIDGCVSGVCDAANNAALRVIADATGAVIGCGDAATCSTGAYTNSIPLKNVAGSADQGCMPSTATKCPTTTYTFAVYGVPVSPSRTPPLLSCRPTGVTCGDAANFGTGDSTVKIVATVTDTTAIGCTAPSVDCPAAAPYFRVTATGTLSATDVCFVQPPTSCPAGDTALAGSIPVRVSSTSPILGCITAAAASAALAVTCPTTVPVAGDYSFFMAAGYSVTASTITGSVTPGDIIECHAKTASRNCAGFVPVKAYDAATTAAPPGCIVLAGNTAACPNTGFTGTGPPAYKFNLYGPTSSTDATPKLEYCITNPQTDPTVPGDGGRSCTLVVPAATYTVPISTNAMDASLTGAELTGCMRPANTACPETYQPRISSTLQIQQCRQAVSTDTCLAPYLPLCRADIAADELAANGGCNDGDRILGCFEPTGSSITAQCAQLTSPSGYPAGLSGTGAGAVTYKFVVALNGQAQGTLVSCANMGTLSTCNVVSTYVNRAYPTGAAPDSSAFSGCTDQDEGVCDLWWTTARGDCVPNPP